RQNICLTNCLMFIITWETSISALFFSYELNSLRSNLEISRWTPETRTDQDCVLPCVFEAVGDETIYWFRQNVPIHSSKQGSGQLDHPNQGHKGRTSLFTEMISSGNASLHIQKLTHRTGGSTGALSPSRWKVGCHKVLFKSLATINLIILLHIGSVVTM
uniref:Immunoglobulin V-set domain-containing protein n=1 Tax=Sinocyclocheilus grahami TaxID=75366 RepID=A0A672Q6H5_SINGR